MKTFTAKNIPDYNTSLRKNLTKSFLFGITFTLILISISLEWYYAILFGLMMFVVSLMKGLNWNRYYIVELMVDDNDVNIKYKDNGMTK